ncbi:hypothetical protein [Cupriavidus campinensis]|uniref:hypothetical protein n=1 Tax=Cupriavidus campinensis TaxID=151783 RepID=UPI00360BF213
MTGRHSDEFPDRIQPQRSTDSQEIENLPQSERGVVQDSPGTQLNVEGDRLLTDQGNYEDQDSGQDETQGNT